MQIPSMLLELTFENFCCQRYCIKRISVKLGEIIYWTLHIAEVQLFKQKYIVFKYCQDIRKLEIFLSFKKDYT